MPATPPRAIALSERLYRWLLVSYPPEFRHEYGAEMARLFRDCCRDAYRRARVRGLAAFWARTLLDLARTAPAEHVEQFIRRMTMRRKTMILIPLAVVFDLALGYLNTHTDETGVVASSILLLAAILGALQPRRAWLWGLAISLALPASQAIMYALHLHVPYANSWSDAAKVWIPGLVFGLPGAYLGAALGWGMAKVVGKPQAQG